MKAFLFISACFYVTIGLAQEPLSTAKDSLILYGRDNDKTLTLNINSKQFIRIFDGFELKTDEQVPKNIQINAVKRLSDSIKLKKIGIVTFTKPLMFLSSFASGTRRFIYTKAKLDDELRQINLPIILNNELITFDKYHLLDNLDTNRIVNVKYERASKMKYYNRMPLGVIKVTSD